MPEVQVSQDDIDALAQKMDELDLSAGSRALLNGIMAVFKDTVASPRRSARDLIEPVPEQEQPAVVQADAGSPGDKIRSAFSPESIPRPIARPHFKIGGGRPRKIGGNRPGNIGEGGKG